MSGVPDLRRVGVVTLLELGVVFNIVRVSGAVLVKGLGGGFLVIGDIGGAVFENGEFGAVLDSGELVGSLRTGRTGCVLVRGEFGGLAVIVVLNGTFKNLFNFVSFIMSFPASDSTIFLPPSIAD